MGAKFIIDRRCTVKTTLTLTGLIEGLKHQGALRRVGELVAAGALSPVDPDTKLELQVSPEAGLPGNLTLRELQEQTDALLEHRDLCRQCPSALHGYMGGCITYLPYPLSDGLEYLLWLTAVQGLEGRMPRPVLAEVQAFAERAMRLERTPYADGMRARGDLLAPKCRVYASGLLWKRSRLTSSQVLEAFFLGGVLAGDDLRIHAGFLAGALALARAMEPAMSTDEKRRALLEDVAPYAQVYELMDRAQGQGLGVYVWP